MTMLYTAYPIDQHHSASMVSFYELVTYAQDLWVGQDLAQVVFDPGDAFKVEPVTQNTVLDGGIAAVNALALRRSTHVIAFLPRGVPTIGVPIEIDRAVGAGKWVAIFTDGASFSLQEYRTQPRVVISEMTEAGVREACQTIQARASQEATTGSSVTHHDPDGPSLLPVSLGPGGRLPSRGYDDDAGLDLYVVGTHTLRPDQFVDLPCKISIELPSWVFGVITGRSSTLRNNNILVHTGIIDPGWRGELFAGAKNVGKHDVIVHDGERVAQLIILPNVTREFYPGEVRDLRPSERGTNGFGSTGK